MKMNDTVYVLTGIIKDLTNKRDYWLAKISADNTDETNRSYDDTAYGLQLAINLVNNEIRELM